VCNIIIILNNNFEGTHVHSYLRQQQQQKHQQNGRDLNQNKLKLNYSINKKK